MIELKEIAGYNGSFPYGNETNLNKKKPHSEFDSFLGENELGENNNKIDGSRKVSKTAENENKKSEIEFKEDFLTYDVSGKILELELFTGLNVNSLV